MTQPLLTPLLTLAIIPQPGDDPEYRVLPSTDPRARSWAPYFPVSYVRYADGKSHWSINTAMRRGDGLEDPEVWALMCAALRAEVGEEAWAASLQCADEFTGNEERP
jgi:hypothetical protein